MLPTAGHIFEKWHLRVCFCTVFKPLLRLSSRGLAGVLPPAGQISEKWHLLDICGNLPKFFVPFKQGSSRGAASGGSDF